MITNSKMKMEMKTKLTNQPNFIFYVKKSKTKLFSILLIFLIITNFAFEKTKTYSFVNDKNVISTVFSHEQYEAAIYASDISNLIDLAKMRLQVNYLHIFPEESILLVYFGYFIALSGIILNFKILRNDGEIN